MRAGPFSVLISGAVIVGKLHFPLDVGGLRFIDTVFDIELSLWSVGAYRFRR
jgi:hypothetical protein